MAFFLVHLPGVAVPSTKKLAGKLILPTFSQLQLQCHLFRTGEVTQKLTATTLASSMKKQWLCTPYNIIPNSWTSDWFEWTCGCALPLDFRHCNIRFYFPDRHAGMVAATKTLLCPPLALLGTTSFINSHQTCGRNMSNICQKKLFHTATTRTSSLNMFFLILRFSTEHQDQKKTANQNIGSASKVRKVYNHVTGHVNSLATRDPPSGNFSLQVKSLYWR